MIVDLTVEIPRGSRNVYSIDRDSGRVRLERTLLTEMVYPADSGYLEDTLDPRGEPLSALVLLEEPTFPGVSITVRPVGIFRLTGARGDEAKIITVPVIDPRWATTFEITDVAEHTRQAVQHFYQHVADLDSGEFVTVGGFGTREEAERLTLTALNAFRSYDSYEN